MDVTAHDQLEAGVLQRIVHVVELLTRRHDYNERIRQSPHARAVRLADIADKPAPWRVARLDELTQDRLSGKYRKAVEELRP